MSNYKVSVNILGNADPLKAALKSAEHSLRSFDAATKLAGKSAGAIGDGMMRAGSAIARAGDMMTRSFTIPFVTAIGAAVVEGARFEDQMVKVKKTTGANGSEIRQLGNRYQELSRGMRTSAIDLAKIGEVAGQLGIHGVKQLGDFTETIAKLVDTTNLTVDNAATDMAHFMNIIGKGASVMGDQFGPAVKKVADVLVHLGNNTATTEADILSMATRIASMSKSLNMSEADTLALSAAMRSLGITTERGATNIQKTFAQISRAVARGGAELEKFVKYAGGSAEEFARLWNTRPLEAFKNLVGGMKKAVDEGKNMELILDELGIKGMLQREVLRSLVNGYDELTRAMDLAQTAMLDGSSALDREFAESMNSVIAKVMILVNNIRFLANKIYQVLRPAIMKTLDSLVNFTKKLGDMNTAQLKSILSAVGFVAALGPLLSIVGRVTQGFGALAVGFGMLSSGVKVAGKGFAGFVGSLLKTTSATIGFHKGSQLAIAGMTTASAKAVQFGSVMGALRSAFTLAKGGIMAFVSQMPMVYTAWSRFTNLMLATIPLILNGTMSATMAAMNSLTGLLFGTSTIMSGTVSVIQAGAQAIALGMKLLFPAAAIAVALAGLGFLALQFSTTIDSMLNTAITKGPQIISGLGNGIISKIPMFINVATSLIAKFAQAIATNMPAIMQKGVEIITTLVTSLGSNLGSLISSGVQIIGAILQGIAAQLPQIMLLGLQLVMDLANAIVSNIGQIATTGLQIITTFITAMLAKLPAILQVGVQGVGRLIQGIVQALPTIISVGFQAIGRFLRGIMQALPSILGAGAQILGMLVVGILQAIGNLIGTGLQAIGKFIEGVRNGSVDVRAIGREIIGILSDGFFGALKGFASMAKGFFKGLWDGITNENRAGAEQAIEPFEHYSQGAQQSLDALSEAAMMKSLKTRRNIVDNIEPIPGEAGQYLGQYKDVVSSNTAEAAESALSNSRLMATSIPEEMWNMSENVKPPIDTMRDNLANNTLEMANNSNMNFQSMSQGAYDALTGLNDQTAQIVNQACTSIAESTGRMKEQVMTNFQGLSEGVGTALDGVSTKVTTSMASIANVVSAGCMLISLSMKTTFYQMQMAILEGMDSAITAIQGRMQSMNTTVQTAMTQIQTTTTQGLTNVGNAFKTAFQAIEMSTASAMNQVRSITQQTMVATVSVIQTGVSRMGSAMANGMRNISMNVRTTFVQMTSQMRSQVNVMRSTVQQGFTAIKTTITNLMRQAQQAADRSAKQITRGFQNEMRNTTNAARQGGQAIVNVFRALRGPMYSAGVMAGSGFASGLASQRGRILGVAYSIAAAVRSVIRSALRIHSPSRVMMKLGAYTGEGFALGLEKTETTVGDVMTRISKMVESAVQAISAQKIQSEITSKVNAAYQMTAKNQETASNAKQSVKLYLQLSDKTWSTFVDDISDTQGKKFKLVEEYGF